MEQLELCDKLRFLQKHICNSESTESESLCKEIKKTLVITKCPECPLQPPTDSYKVQSAPPGCGIGIFTGPG